MSYIVSNQRLPPRQLLDIWTELRSAHPFDRRRRDMASALSTLERASGRTLVSIAADTRVVRNIVRGVHPTRHNLTKRRWANVISLVFKALDAAGVRKKASKAPLSVEWVSALAPLPDKPYRIGLLPLARFCSDRNVTPDSVDQQMFDDYENELERTRGRTLPRVSFLAACRAWNAAHRDFAHWPRFRVDPGDQRLWYSLPWTAFPASLAEDVKHFLTVSSAPDPFVHQHRAIRKTTAQNRKRLIRAFASAVVHRGRPASELRSLADLITVEAARDGLTFLIERCDSQRSAYNHQFARLLVLLARHWVYRNIGDADVVGKNLRDQHIGKLLQIQKNLAPRRVGMTAKNRSVLRSFDDEQAIGKLLSLPERIWREYDLSDHHVRSALIRVQVALAIEILTVAPIRRQNLVSLRPQENFAFVGTGSQRRLHIYLEPCDVKNNVEIEFEVPAVTARRIQRYRTEILPLLTSEPSEFLFPGQTGSYKCAYMFGNQIADLTADQIGVRITTHQFRHLAAFLYLKANPGAYEVVRRLLGHKNIATTLDFYTSIEAREAFRSFDQLIEKMRFSNGRLSHETR